MADDVSVDERPSKRTKLSLNDIDEGQNTASSRPAITNDGTIESNTVSVLNGDQKELEVGIMAYVSPGTLPFEAILKKRYSDFLVNEILPNGEIVHLTNTTTSTLSDSLPSPSQSDKAEEANGPAGNAPATSKTTSPNGEQPVEQTASEQEKSSIKEPLLEPGEISDTDKSLLIGFLNEDAVTKIIDLYKSIIKNPQKKPREQPTVRTEFTSNRSIRTEIHGAIRRIFSSRIETTTDNEGFLRLTAAPPPSRREKQRQNRGIQPERRRGKLGWMDRGGEFLHFTLFKENKDTMEAISFLTRQLKVSAKIFQFAGTKDRRAVTAQRVSAYRVEAERLSHLNRTFRNAAMGNFEYKTTGLELGELSGNEFVLTLRECNFSTSTDSVTEHDLLRVEAALKSSLSKLNTNGFINYYGLQRFGTYTTRTDMTGLFILKDDFKSACDSILDYNPEHLVTVDSEDNPSDVANVLPKVGRDEVDRAKAINIFKVKLDAHDALEILPRKFNAENQLIRHLAKSSNDYTGAILAIPRNLRLMYVHAYQSFVWNHVASRRWELFGSNVVAGDLVLIKEHKDKPDPEDTAALDFGAGAAQAEDMETTDADGEIIIQPQSNDRAIQVDDAFDRARALTSAEIDSGRYTIFDIVLPLPGHDILYPSNATGDFYKSFMATDELGNLDPHNMHRKHRDFSLTGSYRKLIARIGQDFAVNMVRYSRDEEQFVKTDLDKIREKQGSQKGKGGNMEQEASKQDVDMQDTAVDNQDEIENKIAAVLKFQLGSSQYATMALRELSHGGIVGHKTEFSGAR